MLFRPFFVVNGLGVLFSNPYETLDLRLNHGYEIFILPIERQAIK